jgi:hypothetical protein
LTQARRQKSLADWEIKEAGQIVVMRKSDDAIDKAASL